ncbi:Uncharacterized membrane protein [Thermoactinomyces sp. DSM 45891]|uniref:hypothetical protein n=1 Tax=Thermoactinomyces sp. DSM 45891 TaxID=1761907 RepID=UPI00091992D8|nr:hypothetical protein [Thermoactinomyces sp. DSM 45891]SFX45864.1 Uncharacterized membrane protein [Thermoactinomyces sp. DSM 45891]
MSLALFLHLFGLVVWIGASITIGVLLLSICKLDSSASRNQVLTGILKKSYMLIHPAGTVVLASGFYMLFAGWQNLVSQGTPKPFWLTFMQHGGTLAAVLSLVVASILSGKAMKQLTQKDAQTGMLKAYVGVTFATVLFSLVILYFAAAKPF